MAGGLQGLGALPLWLVEGMAEYMSVGRDDPLTAMWMRDAILGGEGLDAVTTLFLDEPLALDLLPLVPDVLP